MTTIELERPETEEELVFGWRLEQLERAGYREADAVELAMRTDVDLHLATDLVRRGCATETALQILL